MEWKHGPQHWMENGALYVTIPFTWNLPTIRYQLKYEPWSWDKVVIGGPAVRLLPDFLNGIENIEIKDHYPDVLQTVYPWVTRTTLGCPRSCGFCAVDLIEGEFRELDDWPDLPNIIDSNLLAASPGHIDRVFDRLEKHKRVDFSQGLDFRLITDHIAERLTRIKGPVRISFDRMEYADSWSASCELLNKHGIVKDRIRVYILLAYDTGPEDAWKRFIWARRYDVAVLPMWYHSLDQLVGNVITEEQKELGWTETARKDFHDECRKTGWDS